MRRRRPSTLTTAPCGTVTRKRVMIPYGSLTRKDASEAPGPTWTVCPRAVAIASVATSTPGVRPTRPARSICRRKIVKFAALVQLLEDDKGEYFVRFAYSTDGVARRGPVTLRRADLERLRTALKKTPTLAAVLDLAGV